MPSSACCLDAEQRMLFGCRAAHAVRMPSSACCSSTPQQMLFSRAARPQNLLTGPQPPAVADPEMVVLDMAADGTDAERQPQSALPRASPPVSPPVVKGQ
eukprot:6185374-Pleurochrysis_carterae.AAC.1